MVGHSIGAIFVRKYAPLYPAEVAGLVLLDSAYEEQFACVSQISPEWAQRIRERFPANVRCAGVTGKVHRGLALMVILPE
jgi:pimeloyl-ACP methyl ester carboxylesterase